MTRVPGLSLEQLDRLADDYAGLVARSLAHAAQQMEVGTGVEDVGVLRDWWRQNVEDELLPALGVAFEVGAAQVRVGVRETLGLTAAAWNDVPVTSDALSEQYLAQARNRLVGVGDELWAHAREGLLEGLQAGESVPELAARVRKAAPDMTEARATVIARTEVLGASNAGALEQVLATGMTGTKEWLAADDERTRHDHDKADDQVVPLREHFTVGGFPMLRPHDPAGPPHLTVNCRCSLAFDLDLESGGPAGLPTGPPTSPDRVHTGVIPDDSPGVRQGQDRSFLARVFADGLAALVGWFKARTASATLPEREFDQEGHVTAHPEHWHAVMATEGVSTGLRQFSDGAITWRNPPFALMWQKMTPESGGHALAVQVGLVSRVERRGGEIHGWGPLDLGSDDGREYARQLVEGFARWGSVGPDENKVDVEVVMAEEVGEPTGLELFLGPGDPEQFIFHSFNIAEFTAVSIPALADATIEATPALHEALGAVAPEPVAVAAAAKVASLEDYRPPAGWFAPLGLQEPTGIVVTEEGQVYGHAATWASCHIGFANECVSPPQEADHPYFLTGEIVCSGGERVPVGQVTLGTGHAPLSYGAPKAAEHYDDTGSVVADVTCGNDEHGIWVAGAIRPGTDPARVHELRASGQLSGDWRRIGGQLRLVALLAVNVPGFPVPRPRARVASGDPVALVAAGKVAHDAGQGGPDLSRVADRLARSIGRDATSRREALAARVGRG